MTNILSSARFLSNPLHTLISRSTVVESTLSGGSLHRRPSPNKVVWLGIVLGCVIWLYPGCADNDSSPGQSGLGDGGSSVADADTTEGADTAASFADTQPTDVPTAEDSSTPDVISTDTPEVASAILKADPAEVDFGTLKIGQIEVQEVSITNVGTAQTDIVSLFFEGAPEFTILDGPKTHSPDVTIVLDPPITLKAGASWTFVVRAEATSLAAASATIHVFTTNNDEPTEALTIAAMFNEEVDPRRFTTCPVAQITVQEGDAVIPQTVLHLDGNDSFAKEGVIHQWLWQVDQPPGSQSPFLPNAKSAKVTFEVNVSGIYTFSLDVVDSNDKTSCFASIAEVVVIPDEAIHVELVWDTPADSDQQDEGPDAGADLDLHFTHPFADGPDIDNDGAPDPWFNNPFDCYWFNPNPDWASFNSAVDDDPSLDRDDTDGAGPENLNLNIPEAAKTYRVSVHYWYDSDFGPSLATVRIYIYGDLVFESPTVQLVNHDMWDVASIAGPWLSEPTLKVTPVSKEDGTPKIAPNYENPFFWQP